MSHYGVTSDLSLGLPSSTMGRPIFSQRPLLQLESPNPFYACSPHLEFYVKALEDERQKIDAFKRELPICMQLLDDAIEASREQLTKGFSLPLGSSTLHMSCDANGKTSFSNEKRGADELVIWKPNWEKQAEGDEDVDKEESRPWSKSLERESSQEHSLWKHDNFHSRQNEPSPTRCIKLELEQNPKVFETKLLAKANEMDERTPTVKRDCRLATSSQYGGLCINGSPRREAIKEQIQKEGLCTALDPDPKGMRTADMLDFRRKETVSPASAAAPGRSNSSSQQPRKARRCWSPELHQRFLQALHQLGGPQVATPKQIRELMNVEGLTNDEVKSHLQKFRLHTRRPPFGGVAAQAAEQAQHGPHLVVFGSIWVPPDYGGAHTSGSPPLATPAQQSAGNIYGGHAQKYAQISPSLLNHATTEYNYFQSQKRRNNLVCQNLMQDQQPMQIQLSESETQDRMEAASEEDVARSESSSLNGEAGRVDDQEEETEIQFGFRRTD